MSVEGGDGKGSEEKEVASTARSCRCVRRALGIVVTVVQLARVSKESGEVRHGCGVGGDLGVGEEKSVR